MKTLSDLRTGETGVIDTITDRELSLKLFEMGCLPGESITMGKKAPLGDPVCITVAGYTLSLRKTEAATILLHNKTL